MTHARKEFEKDVYIQCDSPAKEAMKIHLELSGHCVTIPPEDYGVDLFSDFKQVRMFHEVEVSLGWMKGVHPYHKGSVPERKYRLVEMHLNVPLYFWMLRSDFKRAIVFSSMHIINRWLVEVPNKKVPKDEFFYRIPKQLGKEFDLLCP